MRTSTLLVALLLAAGCGGASSPCDGVSGACLGARIEGTATGLDQLRITVDKPAARSVISPSVASPFSLPVKLAVELPFGIAGDLTVTIDGLSNGARLASTGQVRVTLDAAGRGEQTFRLDAGTIDAGGLPDGD